MSHAYQAKKPESRMATARHQYSIQRRARPPRRWMTRVTRICSPRLSVLASAKKEDAAIA